MDVNVFDHSSSNHQSCPISSFHSGMEQFWSSSFAWFFRSFLQTDGHLWTLQPVTLPPTCNEWKWHQFSYSSKVRFICPVSWSESYSIVSMFDKFSHMNVYLFYAARTRLDFDEGSRRLLVLSPPTGRSDHRPSALQTVRSAVQHVLRVVWTSKYLHAFKLPTSALLLNYCFVSVSRISCQLYGITKRSRTPCGFCTRKCPALITVPRS